MSHRAGALRLREDASQANEFGRRPKDVGCLPKPFGGAGKSHLPTTGSR